MTHTTFLANVTLFYGVLSIELFDPHNCPIYGPLILTLLSIFGHFTSFIDLGIFHFLSLILNFSSVSPIKGILQLEKK